MLKRVLPLAMALTIWLTAGALADEQRDALIIKAAGFKLTIWELGRDKDNEQTYDVPFDAKFISSPDGKEISLESLKKDALVRVTTTKRGETTWVVRVEVLPDDKTRIHDGLLLKAGDGTLRMADRNGKNVQTYLVAEDVKISDGAKDYRLEDLRAGALVTVKLAQRGEKVLAVDIKVRPAK